MAAFHLTHGKWVLADLFYILLPHIIAPCDSQPVLALRALRPLPVFPAQGSPARPGTGTSTSPGATSPTLVRLWHCWAPAAHSLALPSHGAWWARSNHRPKSQPSPGLSQTLVLLCHLLPQFLSQGLILNPACGLTSWPTMSLALLSTLFLLIWHVT